MTDTSQVAPRRSPARGFASRIATPFHSDRFTATLQLAPALAYLGIFFLVPFTVLVAYGFYRAGFPQATAAFQFEAYETALTDPVYRKVLLTTLWVGMAVALIAVAIAYIFSYIVTYVFRMRREILIFLVVASLFSGYLARIYAWRTILGAEGLVNTLLEMIGVIDDPLRLLLNSRFAIGIVLLNIYLPFAILPIVAAMENVPRDVLDGARDLGAGRLTVFRTIMLPLTHAGGQAAFAFCFLLAAGDYVTPALVGGGKTLMVGNVIVQQFGASFNWPLGSALAVVTITAIMIVFLLVDRVMRLVAR